MVFATFFFHLFIRIYACLYVKCNRQTTKNMHKCYYYWASGIQHCMPELQSIVNIITVTLFLWCCCCGCSLLLMIFTMYVCVMSHKFYFCIFFLLHFHCILVMHVRSYCLLSSQVFDCVLCLTWILLCGRW